MKFECPECKGIHLDEIMVDCIVSTEIHDMTFFGPDYGTIMVTYGEVDHYECQSCSYVLKFDGTDGKVLNDDEDLLKWLYLNDMLDEDEVINVKERFEDTDWIACKDD